jgi:lipoprotein LprG
MAHPPRVRAFALVAFVLVAPLLFAGCGQSKDKADEKSPAQVMEQAKKHFDDASSVHLALSTGSVPPSGDGVLGATGDVTHDPAFKGDVKVLFQGFPAELPVTAVGGKVYAKLPFSAKTAVIDPADYGVPDPAEFASPENGLSRLLTEQKDLKKGKETRNGDEILTTYTGTLPGATVKKIIPSAEAGKSYDIKVGVDEKGYATTVKVTGAFFNGSDDVTYDVKFSDYDKGVKITAPRT